MTTTALITALIVTPDGAVRPRAWESEPSLDTLQMIVGGLIQQVTFELTGTDLANYRLTAFCNEEGKLLGLPPNPVATEVARLRARNDVFAGTVVFFLQAEDGALAGIPARLRERIMTIGRSVIAAQERLHDVSV